MINTLQKRPQSKSYKANLEQARPITRSNDQDQAQKCFQMGKEHHNRNDIDKAQKFYLEAIVHNPAHFKSYCNLGLCYKQRSQFPNSIQAYQQSLAINPHDAITNYNLANVYRLIGNEDKSISHYLFVINLKEKQGVDVGSLYFDSYNNLGICYKNIENFTQAIECFEKIIKEKPSEEIVKFNLAVCYLRVIRRLVKSSKKQNAMLLRQNITKTTSLFQQVLKNEPKNEFAALALIELSSVSNQEHENIKKCLTELEGLTKISDKSGFITDQILKVKSYCLKLLAKYEQSAEEQRKAIEKKREEEQRRWAEQKERQRILQEKQKQQAKKKAEKQQQKALSTKLIEPPPQPVPQPVQPANQQPIKPLQSPPVPETNSRQVFQTMLSSLVVKLNNIIEDEGKLDEQKNISETLQIVIETLQKEHLANNKDMKLTQRIRKQLSIIGCSILGQNLIDNDLFAQAFDTYVNYFLQGKIQNKITPQALFLQTHRAIASVLTSLGESEKAIEHYQIISRQFTKKNVHEKDPLHELHSGLAVNYESQGLHEKAIREFEQAIRINPGNYIFYYNLGYCQHCAGQDADAVKSYSKFLEEVQKETTLDSQSRQSYILQALISILICSEGKLEEKMAKCEQIDAKIVEFSGSEPQNLLRLVDQNTLMHYYLLACDLHEQVIFDLQKSSKDISKKHKEKLFSIYINLLALPNCPDRDEILINCGNLLFEEREFFSALQFYEKVSRSKTEVFNIIALTLMMVNEHERAVSSMEVALQSDKTNTIYQVNYEIMKWAYGLEITNPHNLLWKMYPSRRDVDFDSRVQYSKSLVGKLTAIIELELSKASYTERLTVQSIFNKLLSEKEEANLWQEPESLLKHNVLKEHVQRRCGVTQEGKVHHSFDKNQVKQILQAITSPLDTSLQSISKTLNQLNQHFNDPHNKQSSDYLTILEQSSALFIFQLSKDQNNTPIITQHLRSKISTIKTYDITFTDEVTPNPNNYPEKTYTVVYPSIELKQQNLIQSLLSWNTSLQDKFAYLLKIIESVAYKYHLRSPLLADYNFPCYKYIQNCEKNFKKACSILPKLFNFNCIQKNSTSTKSNQSLKELKKKNFSLFADRFGKNLQPILTTTPGKDAKTLSVKLNEQTLPMQIQINFDTQEDFQKFLKDLCAQVSVKQPVYDKNDTQLYLTLNKLVRVRCTWRETDFIEDFIFTIVNSPFSLKETAVEFFDADLLKAWSDDQNLKPTISKIFDTSRFLQ